MFQSVLECSGLFLQHSRREERVGKNYFMHSIYIIFKEIVIFTFGHFILSILSFNFLFFSYKYKSYFFNNQNICESEVCKKSFLFIIINF